jgi:hypothetical protein
VYHAFRKTIIDLNIFGAFPQIGLTFHVFGNIVRAPFDEIRLRESLGFEEPVEINYHPEALTARRQNAQIGWINKVE